MDDIYADRSLVDAIAQEFLGTCAQSLRADVPGQTILGTINSTEAEVLSRSGENFIRSMGWRALGLRGLDSAQTLYTAMNAVSALPYEGSRAAGRFVLSGEASGQAGVRFFEAIPLFSTKRVRKLLELSSDDRSLVIGDDGLEGIVDSAGEPARFETIITGYHQWRLLIDGEAVCEICDGMPRIPKPAIEQEEFSELCDRLLPADADADALYQLAVSCIRQRHGTTLVVSSHAQLEAERLAKQSTRAF